MRPYRSYLPFVAPVLLYFLCGAALLIALPYGAEVLYFNVWRTPTAGAVVAALTKLGEAWAYAIAAAALLWYRRYKQAAYIVTTGLLVMPLAFVLKDWFAVPRPATYFEMKGQADLLVTPPDVPVYTGMTSFPSGHTFAAFALYTALALITPRAYRNFGLLWASLAIVTALTRIFLAQHFVPDVLFGAALGISLAYALWLLFRRYF